MDNIIPLSTHSLNNFSSAFYFEYRKYYGSKSKYRHTMINIKECWNCRLSSQNQTISALKFKFVCIQYFKLVCVLFNRDFRN